MNKLSGYSARINEISSSNPSTAPMLVQHFLIAYDVCNTEYCKAVQADCEVKNLLEAAEAIAKLEKSGPYLETNKLKDTAEARKSYAAIDPDVIAVQNIKALTEALSLQLRNDLNKFHMAHDDVKKIAYDNTFKS